MTEVLGRDFNPNPSLGQPGGQVPAETAAALRWLRAGLSEETMRLELPPDIRSTISPIITALRWGALLYGMVRASTEANAGEVAVVGTLAVALFLTVWRTFRPLRLAWQEFTDRSLPILDGVLIGGAAGASGGIDSPFVYCLLVAVGVSAFGWGLRSGILTVVASLLAMSVVSAATGNPLNLNDVGGIAFLFVLLCAAVLIALMRDNLITRQSERVAMSGRLNMLTETNEMLGILNQVARTLPESMDMTEAVNATERELAAQFRASTIGLVVRDEATQHWLPMISEGCHFFESTPTSELPRPMQTALLEMTTLVNTDTDGDFVNPGSTSGLYTALRTRGKVIGILAVENTRLDDYDDRQVRILDGLSERACTHHRQCSVVRSAAHHWRRPGTHPHCPRPARSSGPVADVHLDGARTHHRRGPRVDIVAVAPWHRADRHRRTARDAAPTTHQGQRQRVSRYGWQGNG